jgi:hypothetical protein
MVQYTGFANEFAYFANGLAFVAKHNLAANARPCFQHRLGQDPSKGFALGNFELVVE